MVQESIYNVAIIGGGPAGCTSAYFLQNKCEVTVFEEFSPLKTLLPTGGGRCNLAHNEFDFKELASFYPRGEKFLYSVFSKFSTFDTLEMFKNIGVETYTQDDGRIFPISNSATEVRDKFLNILNKVEFKRERVLRVNSGDQLSVITDLGSYKFDKVIVATGGHAGYNIAKYLDINVIEPRPSLVGLKTSENFEKISGVSLKNVCSKGFKDDLLFTHSGISGPLAYKISSIMARENFPYKIYFKIIDDFDMQEFLNNNPHKNIVNLLAEFVPKSFALFVLKDVNINSETKCFEINGKMRDEIMSKLMQYEITVTGSQKDGEVVTSGGVDLDEINPTTLEAKKVRGLYFTGEVLDIDGFCGGFNLQNCWSTGYVAAQSIIEELQL